MKKKSTPQLQSETKPVIVSIQEVIQDILERNHITQAQLARDIGNMSPMMVTQWMSGRSLPTSASLHLMSELYGIPIEVVTAARDYSRALKSTGVFADKIKEYFMNTSTQDPTHTTTTTYSPTRIPENIAHVQHADLPTRHTVFSITSPEQLTFMGHAKLVCKKVARMARGEFAVVVTKTGSCIVAAYDPDIHQKHVSYKILSASPQLVKRTPPLISRVGSVVVALLMVATSWAATVTKQSSSVCGRAFGSPTSEMMPSSLRRKQTAWIGMPIVSPCIEALAVLGSVPAAYRASAYHGSVPAASHAAASTGSVSAASHAAVFPSSLSSAASLSSLLARCTPHPTLALPPDVPAQLEMLCHNDAVAAVQITLVHSAYAMPAILGELSRISGCATEVFFLPTRGSSLPAQQHGIAHLSRTLECAVFCIAVRAEYTLRLCFYAPQSYSPADFIDGLPTGQ